MRKISRQAHNTVAGWQRGLVVKFMVGSSGIVYRLPFVVLGVALCLIFAAAQVLWHNQRVQEQRLLDRISELEQEKSRVETFLQRKDREKKQALALAQLRSDELWEELQQRDRQIEQIWKVVGKSPAAKASGSRIRRSLSGSRGRTHPLALKRRYLEMQKVISGGDGEIAQLRSAAISYRNEKVRQAELAMWNTRPSLWPCSGFFSSPFGYRIHPVMGYARFHSGCDISAPTGTPIRATAAGRVTCADWLGGYGLAVTVDHGKGVSTLYGHCSAVSVRSGQYVRKGQVVASVGSTGMSTGPHCHYEVSVNGAQVDPAPYMRSRK